MKTSSLIESVEDHFPDAVSASHTYRGDATVILRRESLVEVARFLKEDPALQMNFLMDLTAVDYSTFGKGPTPAFSLPPEWRRVPLHRSRMRIPGPDPRTSHALRSCTTFTPWPTSIDFGLWSPWKRPMRRWIP